MNHCVLVIIVVFRFSGEQKRPKRRVQVCNRYGFSLIKIAISKFSKESSIIHLEVQLTTDGVGEYFVVLDV